MIFAAKLGHTSLIPCERLASFRPSLCPQFAPQLNPSPLQHFEKRSPSSSLKPKLLTYPASPRQTHATPHQRLSIARNTAPLLTMPSYSSKFPDSGLLPNPKSPPPHPPPPTPAQRSPHTPANAPPPYLSPDRSSRHRFSHPLRVILKRCN
jgi:hypothetical protein